MNQESSLSTHSIMLKGGDSLSGLLSSVKTHRSHLSGNAENSHVEYKMEAREAATDMNAQLRPARIYCR